MQNDTRLCYAVLYGISLGHAALCSDTLRQDPQLWP